MQESDSTPTPDRQCETSQKIPDTKPRRFLKSRSKSKNRVPPVVRVNLNIDNAPPTATFNTPKTESNSIIVLKPIQGESETYEHNS